MDEEDDKDESLASSRKRFATRPVRLTQEMAHMTSPWRSPMTNTEVRGLVHVLSPEDLHDDSMPLASMLSLAGGIDSAAAVVKHARKVTESDTDNAANIIGGGVRRRRLVLITTSFMVVMMVRLFLIILTRFYLEHISIKIRGTSKNTHKLI